jgi:Fe-S oxidoreductase/nitrate reductase gamma subunit
MDPILCPPGVPCRIGWWNIPIPLRIVFFAMMAAATAIMVYGIVQRIKLWRIGQGQPGFDQPGRRLKRVLKYAVVQARILRQSYPAVMHLLIFWTMALFFAGTVLGSLDTDVFELIINAKLLRGDFYLLEKIVLDLAALAALIGLGLAIYRRYIMRPDRLNTDPQGASGSWRFSLTLPLLACIVLTGLLVEALRLAAQQPAWAPFSVVAFPISRLFASLDEAALLGLHRGAWIIHFSAVAVGFATLPWTNLLHVITSAVNVFVAPFRARGALAPIADLETTEQLGVSKIGEFPWPRLVNVDACTECGRCQAVCPAHAAGQPLNPKQLVLDLRGALTAAGRQRMGTDKRMAPVETGGKAEGAPRHLVTLSPCHLVGDIIKPETLWACTTCYACVYECPVLIEQVDDIVDMRRYIALAQGELPASLATTLTNIERAGNPWKQPKRKRAVWTQGLDFAVPLMRDVGEAEVLWWVGCAGAYDPRNQKVTRAIARILHAAGVDFAILGDEETCTGDAARRAGNEYLFQTLAQANIATLNRYKFTTILTQCPHCLNTLQHEYSQFGGHYQVVHHTQYIAELLAAGRIQLHHADGAKLTVHDPCYLGRYNDIYDAPRTLATAGGMQVVEPPSSRDLATCCGGGGARVWMEDESAVRINHLRLKQIQETGAAQIGVACPFCMIMLEDARGATGAESLVIRDVAEIVADALVASAAPQS